MQHKWRRETRDMRRYIDEPRPLGLHQCEQCGLWRASFRVPDDTHYDYLQTFYYAAGVPMTRRAPPCSPPLPTGAHDQ